MSNSPAEPGHSRRTFEENKSYTVVLAEVATEVRRGAARTPRCAPGRRGRSRRCMPRLACLPWTCTSAPRPRYRRRHAARHARSGWAARGTPLASGDYELWLTEAGNPANVLLATGTVNLPAGNTTSIVIIPEGNRGTAQMSVLFVSSAQETRFDRNATAEIRVLNGTTDRAPRDFAVDGVFSPPLFSATPFGDPTAYAPVPSTAGMPINVTPAGNPGFSSSTRLSRHLRVSARRSSSAAPPAH